MPDGYPGKSVPQVPARKTGGQGSPHPPRSAGSYRVISIIRRIKHTAGYKNASAPRRLSGECRRRCWVQGGCRVTYPAPENLVVVRISRPTAGYWVVTGYSEVWRGLPYGLGVRRKNWLLLPLATSSPYPSSTSSFSNASASFLFRIPATWFV